MTRLLIRLSTRRCTGCTDPTIHTHHLTRIGRLRYTTRHTAGDMFCDLLLAAYRRTSRDRTQAG